MASITIRDVSKVTHRELAARAALKGQSLQEYLRAQLDDLAHRPDADVVIARMRARTRKNASHLSREEILEYRDRGRR
jgi:hypothetical protein